MIYFLIFYEIFNKTNNLLKIYVIILNIKYLKVKVLFLDKDKNQIKDLLLY